MNSSATGPRPSVAITILAFGLSLETMESISACVTSVEPIRNTTFCPEAGAGVCTLLAAGDPPSLVFAGAADGCALIPVASTMITAKIPHTFLVTIDKTSVSWDECRETARSEQRTFVQTGQ